MTSGGAEPAGRETHASHASQAVGVAIPASGMGRRMGGVQKPFLELSGEPVLLWSVRPFLTLPEVTCVAIALPPEVAQDPPAWLTELDSRIRIVAGGETRRKSVWNAIQALPPEVTVIAVHDAARPLVDVEVIRTCLDFAHSGEGAVAGIPAADTLKRVDGENHVVATPDRSELWQAQTPQAFPSDILIEAYRRAHAEGWAATDDSALVERVGGKIRMVEASSRNMKITRPEDVAMVQALMERGS